MRESKRERVGERAGREREIARKRMGERAVE